MKVNVKNKGNGNGDKLQVVPSYRYLGLEIQHKL
jgi:hypothetical protein